MGFVVKISGDSPNWPQWIGQHTRLGPKRLVPRHEARVFPTEQDAQSEAECFRLLLPEGLRFELEEE